MNRPLLFRFLIRTAGVVMLTNAVLVDAETHPHTIVKESRSIDCSKCHKSESEIDEKLFGVADGILDTRNHPVDHESFNLDGTEMCSSCHNPEDGHKVGLEVDFQIPADLPIDKKNRITCLTCHFTHGNLRSERPQASFSLMDRLFDAERLQKSFLLRRNNSDGDLCLTCHTVNQGSNQ